MSSRKQQEESTQTGPGLTLIFRRDPHPGRFFPLLSAPLSRAVSPPSRDLSPVCTEEIPATVAQCLAPDLPPAPFSSPHEAACLPGVWFFLPPENGAPYSLVQQASIADTKCATQNRSGAHTGSPRAVRPDPCPEDPAPGSFTDTHAPSWGLPPLAHFQSFGSSPKLQDRNPNTQDSGSRKGGPSLSFRGLFSGQNCRFLVSEGKTRILVDSPEILAAPPAGTEELRSA